MNYYHEIEPKELVGKTFVSVTRGHQWEEEGDVIIFLLEDGSSYTMEHREDCCETVYLSEIHGELIDLEGSPILSSEYVISKQGYDGDGDGSYTWAFFKIATIKGNVTFRWIGESNGYYCEEAFLYFHEEGEE